MPGVRAVVQVPSGVAVVADHFWAAKLGRDALEVEWDLGPGAALDTEKLRRGVPRRSRPGAASRRRRRATSRPRSRSAAKTVEAEYEFPFLAHAAMEPLNCTVKIGPDCCEIWTGTQFQTGDQGAAAKIAGLEAGAGADPHDVPRRRLRPARESDERLRGRGGARREGRRRAGQGRLDARGRHARRLLPADVGAPRRRRARTRTGLPVAWSHTIVGQSIMAGTPFAMMIKDGIDETSVEGVVDSPYLEAIAAPARRPAHAEVRRPGPLVALGRPLAHRLRDGDLDRRARGRGGQGPARLPPCAAPEDRRATAACSSWPRRRRAGARRCPRASSAASPCTSRSAASSPRSPRSRSRRGRSACTAWSARDRLRHLRQPGRRRGADGVGDRRTASRPRCTARSRSRTAASQQSQLPRLPRSLRMDEMPKVEVHIVASGEKSGGVGEPGTPPDRAGRRQRGLRRDREAAAAAAVEARVRGAGPAPAVRARGPGAGGRLAPAEERWKPH